MNNDNNICPVLSIRDLVVFPHIVVPLFVGREKSINALNAAMEGNKKIVLLTQKSLQNDDPAYDDLYHVGVLGSILQLLRLPDNTVKILIEGLDRIKATECVSDTDYFSVKYEVLEAEQNEDVMEIEAYRRTAIDMFENYSKLNRRISPDIVNAAKGMESVNDLIDIISAHMVLRIKEKQLLLEETSTIKRFNKLLSFMESEIDVINVERKIRSRVKKQMERSQKEYYLNEQIKAIQKELGDPDEVVDEIKEFENRAKSVKFTKEAREKFNSELKKLRNMPNMSPEATVVRNYLDWLITIPWKQKTKIKKDLKEAKKILDKDHYGLDKIKERIIEFLAVQNRVGKVKGTVLCFVGPPGVGKTSLAKSIAKATGRNYVKMSLGGVHDESEIRGHRRTYIGSMPGKIISCMKKAKSSNPLFLLDELDKVGSDWKGDPSSALLEVLDPEQSANFNDHYIEVDYDLSDVMFVATANSFNMPSPLLDRLEIIKLSGYTEIEKLEIAKRHLIEKNRKDGGLSSSELTIDDDAIMVLIQNYTREAGVRALEREIANIVRKSVKEIEESDKKTKNIHVTVDNLEKYAGPKKFKRLGLEDKNLVGVVTGMAWTEVGGELLSIEAISVPGKGKTTLTGKLGDVMQESVHAAISFVRSRAEHYGIDPKVFENTDFHVHVPEGATPKDGPSAGVAMVTSIVSTLTSTPVRKDVAMTGEITLRGRVLPIGGLKEKLLAAHREGIKTVIIPMENESDLQEIPESVLSNLNVVKAETADDVLKTALVGNITKKTVLAHAPTVQ
ncbi:MAG: endopeptidase La [Alphaproteobacteria bacterium]|nr:endopeptidase La [Alphaproteobacteria bacterium]